MTNDRNSIPRLIVQNDDDKIEVNGFDEVFDAAHENISAIKGWLTKRGFPVNRAQTFLTSKNLIGPTGTRLLSNEEEGEATSMFDRIFDDWSLPRLKQVHARLTTVRSDVRHSSENGKLLKNELAHIESMEDDPNYDPNKRPWTIAEVFLTVIFGITCFGSLYVSMQLLSDTLSVLEYGASEEGASPFLIGMTILIAATFTPKAFHAKRKTPAARDRTLDTLFILTVLCALSWIALFAADFAGITSHGKGLMAKQPIFSAAELGGLQRGLQLIGDSTLGAWAFILVVENLIKFGLIRPPQRLSKMYTQKQAKLQDAHKEHAKLEAFVEELESVDEAYENAKNEYTQRCLDTLKARHIENIIPSSTQ